MAWRNSEPLGTIAGKGNFFREQKKKLGQFRELCTVIKLWTYNSKDKQR